MLDEKTWTETVLNIAVFDHDESRVQALVACLEGDLRKVLRITEWDLLLKSIGKGEIDLICLDETAFQDDGNSSIQNIRINASQSLLPILALCRDSKQMTRLAMLKAGANDVISEPFEAPSLDVLIRHHLGIRFEQLASNRKRDRLVLLEKMNALGFLAAGVAHEVANPIGFISVSTENLEADLDGFKKFLFNLIEEEADNAMLEAFRAKLAPISAHLDIIQDGCSRIRNITRELQTFARHRPEEARTVLISGVIANVFGLVKTRYKRRANFSLNEINRLTVKGCAAELTQAFLSLMLNGVESIIRKQEAEDDKTPGKITVSIRVLGHKGMIEISDSGLGIVKEQKAHIFQPGYTTKDDVVTGMGLSLARTIFEDHGGRLRVISRPGEGSTFIGELPVGRGEDDEAEARLLGSQV